MLNCAAVPILTITLRNNIFEVLPCKGLRSKTNTNLQKGLWAIVISIPVLIVACFYRKPQVMLAYTGGITGLVILFCIPTAFVIGARKKRMEEVHGVENFNKSYYSGIGWIIVSALFGLFSFVMVVLGLINHGGG